MVITCMHSEIRDCRDKKVMPVDEAVWNDTENTGIIQY